MKESASRRLRFGSRPEAALESIAGGACVDQVLQFVTAPGGARPEVVNLELRPGFRLVDATVTTASIVETAHLFPSLLLCHDGSDAVVTATS
jgi:hypothetical protein